MGAWGYLKSRPILIALLALVALGWYQAASGNIKPGGSLSAADCGAALNEANTLTASGSLEKLKGTLLVPTLKSCGNSGLLSQADIRPYVN